MEKLLFVFVQRTIENFSPWFSFYELVDLVGERTGTDQGSVKVPVGEFVYSESIGVRWEPLSAFFFAQMLWSYNIPMTLQWQNMFVISLLSFTYEALPDLLLSCRPYTYPWFVKTYRLVTDRE